MMEEGNDEEEEKDEETMTEVNGADLVANAEPQFRTWFADLLAQTNCMRILLKLADFSDTSKVGGSDDDDEDEDFEDCEDMDEEEEKESNAQVIDIDSKK